MEPIEVMKKEKTQLERLEKMRRYIYTPIAELSVEYSPSKEPVAWEKRHSLEYKKLPKNGKWAEVF